jgi:hypothetical protein
LVCGEFLLLLAAEEDMRWDFLTQSHSLSTSLLRRPSKLACHFGDWYLCLFCCLFCHIFNIPLARLCPPRLLSRLSPLLGSVQHTHFRKSRQVPFAMA